MHLHSPDQQSSRELVAGIMRDRINDEKLSAQLIPDFSLGCRRMTPGSGYLESLTRDNVHVVHESVVRMTERGVIDAAGMEHEVDVVVSWALFGFHLQATWEFQPFMRVFTRIAGCTSA
jgi:cation diffusion facilitator CzcD-associated flavoprotein CzcO